MLTAHLVTLKHKTHWAKTKVQATTPGHIESSAVHKSDCSGLSTRKGQIDNQIDR